MKISDYVINTLAAEGVTHIFEICGGALGHLLDSLYGGMISGLSLCTMKWLLQLPRKDMPVQVKISGVAMATSGPGATNLITGIGSCYFDSIPCLFITGQVNTYEYKFGRPVRQIGFQETDIVSIVTPIVKRCRSYQRTKRHAGNTGEFNCHCKNRKARTRSYRSPA